MSVIVDTDNVPMVVLGGKSWPIPLLAARQNRVIDPLILMLLPIFAQWQRDKGPALAAITEKEYDALLEIAFQAIRRATPEIQREAFMELPVSLPELVAAFPVIAQQTGVFVRGECATVGE